MNVKSVFLVLVFALTPMLWAQEQQATPPGGNQARAERREKMMEMHKHEMAAMKADIEKLKSSLAQMKTNVAAIKDTSEKARWQTNVDMWETVVTHMDRMQKQMESMGPAVMPGPGMGGPPPTPPSEQKPL